MKIEKRSTMQFEGGAPALDSVPTMNRHFRLQWEPAQQAHVLLYAEGMVTLNGSAGAILSRCDGQRTVAQIIADLEQAYARKELGGDVLAFLSIARDNRWVQLQ